MHAKTRLTRRAFLRNLIYAGTMVTLGAYCISPKQRVAKVVKKVSGNYISGISGGDAETLNWILAADATSFEYIGLTLDGLAVYDNDFNIQLRWLEKDVEVSEDGLVYTVTLRKDLRWSDGKKVTARDFVYTMKNLMFSDWLNYNYKADWQESIEGKLYFVEPEVKSENVFTITRQTVDPEFIYTVYDLLAYPEHIVRKYEGDIDAFTQAPELNNLAYTGNLGPYKFKEWIRNDKFVVERNSDYYLGKETQAPYFESVVIKLFGDSTARQAALEAGDISHTAIEPENYEKFSRLEHVKLYVVPTNSYSLILYNQRKNAWQGLKQAKIRQALSMAISKESIIRNIRLGFGEAAYSFIPKVSPWYTEEGVYKFGVGELYDKEKARKIIENSGYEKPENLRIVTTSGSAISEKIAFFVKQELSDIGLNAEVNLVPWETLLRKYMMNKVPGSEQPPRYNNGKDAVSEEPWDLIIAGHGTDPLQPSGSSVFFASDGGLNTSGYANPKVDEFFRKAKSEEALDIEKRKEIYAELSRIISYDQPADFLYFPRAIHGFDKRIEGIEPGVNLGYNFHEWYFKEI